MSLRRETRAPAGIVAEGHDVNEPPLPPPPPHVPLVPPAGRGASSVPQAPQGAQFGDLTPLIQAMAGAFQAAVARVHVQAHASVVATNMGLPL
ncbi:hypothetical protein V6N13_073244 [Hibiscus sabdariffa]|uniref:PE family protein n=1 Tax=Hibiscus sabdariffa TaxID=183260 RepID=A0ABR2E8K1_9ROSI